MSIAVVVGSGMGPFVPADSWVETPTPYGTAVVGHVTIGGRQVVVIRRHGPSLNVPPHLINYHANAWALRDLGVRYILSTAAVGSMRLDLPPGSLSVIDDFIDFTKRRVTTVFDHVGESVVHEDFSVPYCQTVSRALEDAAESLGVTIGRRVVYLCVDGPRYETPAEIRMFAQWGGDVVGMTGVPEVVLAREMGMCYGSLAIITNYASGVTLAPLSHAEVIQSVEHQGKRVVEVLGRAVELLPAECGNCRR